MQLYNHVPLLYHKVKGLLLVKYQLCPIIELLPSSGTLFLQVTFFNRVVILRA